jgi:hypothetical protein
VDRALGERPAAGATTLSEQPRHSRNRWPLAFQRPQGGGLALQRGVGGAHPGELDDGLGLAPTPQG